MLTFRPLTKQDRNQLESLVQKLHGDRSAAFSWQWPQFLQELQEAHGWGAFQDNMLVAYVFYRKWDASVEITSLATAPEFRQRGVMGQLLKNWLGGADCANCLVSLEVHESNRAAIALYKSYGFQQVAVRPGYYSDGAGALVLQYKPLQSL